MKLNIIAEGIESSSQIDALLEQGCRIGQGFALSAPLEIDEFTRVLALSPTSRIKSIPI